MISANASDMDSDDDRIQISNLVSNGEEKEEEWHPENIWKPITVPAPSYSTRASSSIESTEPVFRYKDLSDTDYFDPDEMKWAAEYILQRQEEERSQGRDYGARRFASRYGLTPSRVQNWVNKLKGAYGERGKRFYSTRGQPHCIDESLFSHVKS